MSFCNNIIFQLIKNYKIHFQHLNMFHRDKLFMYYFLINNKYSHYTDFKLE